MNDNFKRRPSDVGSPWPLLAVSAASFPALRLWSSADGSAGRSARHQRLKRSIDVSVSFSPETDW